MVTESSQLLLVTNCNQCHKHILLCLPQVTPLPSHEASFSPNATPLHHIDQAHTFSVSILCSDICPIHEKGSTETWLSWERSQSLTAPNCSVVRIDAMNASNDSQTVRQTDRHTDRHTDTDMQTDRQAYCNFLKNLPVTSAGRALKCHGDCCLSYIEGRIQSDSNSR